jgi:hypothetical protein
MNNNDNNDNNNNNNNNKKNKNNKRIKQSFHEFDTFHLNIDTPGSTITPFSTRPVNNNNDNNGITTSSETPTTSTSPTPALTKEGPTIVPSVGAAFSLINQQATNFLRSQQNTYTYSNVPVNLPPFAIRNQQHQNQNQNQNQSNNT